MKRLITVLACMLILAIGCSALAEEEIHLGVNSVGISKGRSTTVMFIAPTSDTYVFYSNSTTDTIGTLYNESKKQIAHNDDGTDSNFRIEYALAAGQVVYLEVRYFSSVIASKMKVCVEKVIDASSAASDESWTCPGCGVKNKSGNFCPSCGSKRPAAAATPAPTAAPSKYWVCASCGAKDNEGNFCASCGSKRPTATQSNTAAKGSFVLNETMTHIKGKHVASWTDENNNGPYTVSYKYVVSGVDHPERPAGGSDETAITFEKSITIPDIAHGTKVMVIVTDKNGNRAERTYTPIEVARFKDGSFTAANINFNIYAQYLRNGEEWKYAKNVEGGAIKASEVISRIDTHKYGVRASLDYQSPGKRQDYFMQLVFRAPNGYTQTEVFEEHPLGGYDAYLYWYLVGYDTFETVYNFSGSIPKGKWTVELYLDGMLAGKKTFEVK